MYERYGAVTFEDVDINGRPTMYGIANKYQCSDVENVSQTMKGANLGHFIFHIMHVGTGVCLDDGQTEAYLKDKGTHLEML